MADDPKAPNDNGPSAPSSESPPPHELNSANDDETFDALLGDSSLGSATASSLRGRTSYSEVARMLERIGRISDAGPAWRAAIAADEPNATNELVRWTRARGVQAQGRAAPRSNAPDRSRTAPRSRIRKERVSVLGSSLTDPSLSERSGPFDSTEAPNDGRLRLDLSSVKIPVPRGARLIAEPDPSGPLRAVHVMVPEGRLTISAFAAPRTGGLWAELIDELADQLNREGASTRRDRGEWGREIVARNGDMVARVIGVDGPRWMLRGVGTGPVESALTLHGMLRAMFRGTIVVRSKEPMPVRSLLPVEMPDEVPKSFAEALDTRLPTRPRPIVGPRPLSVPTVLPKGEKVAVSPGIADEGEDPSRRMNRNR